MIKVESFELDHTKVKAPYVRKAGEDERNGVKITKFDLRFLQPNEKEMPTGAIHTIEHFLATFMREKMDGIIDISPMGCRTGFYMIAWGDVYVDTVIDTLNYALNKILEQDIIPATTAKECGNYRDHSLFAAKEYIKEVLQHGISNNIYR